MVVLVRQNLVGSSSLLRVVGAFVAIFSLAMGMLVLFVIPGACTFVGSLELVILSFLFVIGGLVFLLGATLSWKKRKAEASSRGSLK